MPRKSLKIKKFPVVLPPKRHEPGEKKVLLIDGMNMAYRAYYAYDKVKYKKDGKVIPLSLYYGIPELIRSWIKDECFKVEKIVVFWDGRRDPKRLKAYPEYKGHRDEKRDKKKYKKFLKMVEKVKRLLHYMGIAQAYDPDIEGDDMCYHLVKEFIVFHSIVIISGDKDFDQLINHDVSVYDPRRKTITIPALCGAHNYGLQVNQLVDFYCLTGDKSDNIKGYGGIGEVRAVGFLERFGSIKNYLKQDTTYPGISDTDRLRKIYKRNRKLIDLKYFNEKYYPDYEVKYYKGKYPKFNEEKYLEFCNRYGLRSFRLPKFIDTIKSWHE